MQLRRIKEKDQYPELVSVNLAKTQPKNGVWKRDPGGAQRQWVPRGPQPRGRGAYPPPHHMQQGPPPALRGRGGPVYNRGRGPAMYARPRVVTAPQKEYPSLPQAPKRKPVPQRMEPPQK